jgi:hypothetical protein
MSISKKEITSYIFVADEESPKFSLVTIRRNGDPLRIRNTKKVKGVIYTLTQVVSGEGAEAYREELTKQKRTDFKEVQHHHGKKIFFLFYLAPAKPAANKSAQPAKPAAPVPQPPKVKDRSSAAPVPKQVILPKEPAPVVMADKGAGRIVPLPAAKPSSKKAASPAPAPADPVMVKFETKGSAGLYSLPPEDYMAICNILWKNAEPLTAPKPGKIK